MSTEPHPARRFRRTWIAVLIGGLGLTLLFLASVVAEPYLIAVAKLPAGSEPRSSAAGWANSYIWLAAVGACCVTLFVIGYITKRVSPPSRQSAVVTVLVFVFLYLLFAQFPATKSMLKIAMWSASLPVSLAFGAWLATKHSNAV
jgi:hypothetical protein